MKKLPDKLDKIGFVVTVAGDTLKCKFDFSMGRRNYFVYGMPKPEEMKGKAIRQYNVDGENSFRYVDIDGIFTMSQYLKIIADGKINIYEYGGGGNCSNCIYWYAAKGDGPLKEVKNNVFAIQLKSRGARIKDLLAMIEDQPDVVNYFGDYEEYSYELIYKTVYYHNTGVKLMLTSQMK